MKRTQPNKTARPLIAAGDPDLLDALLRLMGCLVWVNKPYGKRDRKDVYSKDHETAHEKYRHAYRRP